MRNNLPVTERLDLARVPRRPGCIMGKFLPFGVDSTQFLPTGKRE
jgi:hypothetical protein